MKIKNIEIKNGLFLAPMAGVTDYAFRRICREYGAEYTVSEMISAKAVKYGDRKTLELAFTDQTEHPVAVQLFGNETGSFSYAVKYICDNVCCAAIDINMGCPMKKIVGGGDGSVLMRDPKKAAELMNTAVKASVLPVTVKIRSGYTSAEKNAVQIAGIAEKEGISAIFIHGRTREQMYQPPVDLDIIAEVKAAVNIPVIGNGDIVTMKDAEIMRQKTSCDGIMIGRGCLGRPWFFAELKEPDAVLTSGNICDTIIKHVDLAVDTKGERLAVLELRKHLSWYIKNIKNAAYFRNMINKTVTAHEMKDIIRQCFPQT